MKWMVAMDGEIAKMEADESGPAFEISIGYKCASVLHLLSENADMWTTSREIDGSFLKTVSYEFDPTQDLTISFKRRPHWPSCTARQDASLFFSPCFLLSRFGLVKSGGVQSRLHRGMQRWAQRRRHGRQGAKTRCDDLFALRVRTHSVDPLRYKHFSIYLEALSTFDLKKNILSSEDGYE